MLKLKFDFSKCVCVEIFLVFCIVLGTILQNNSLISRCFTISFLILLAYIFLRSLTIKFDLNTLILSGIAVVCVLINSIFSSEANLGFNYFKKMFMFIDFCLMFSLASLDDISHTAKNIVSRLPVFSAILLAVSYFTGINKVMLGEMLTLGFSNPNFTGMWLMHFFIFSFLCMIDKTENKVLRLISAIMLPVIIYLITLTQARSCLLGVAAFIMFSILLGLNISSTLKKVAIVFALIFPLVFAYAYQFLLSSDWFVSSFDFIVSEGKGLDSRLEVWLPAIEAIKESPIWGDYSGISDGRGMSQLHNIHLDVFASYGVIVGVCFLLLLNSKTFYTFHKAQSIYQRCALSGWIAVFVAGTFEAAVVSGAMGMNILTAFLLALACYNPLNSESYSTPSQIRLRLP